MIAVGAAQPRVCWFGVEVEVADSHSNLYSHLHWPLFSYSVGVLATRYPSLLDGESLVGSSHEDAFPAPLHLTASMTMAGTLIDASAEKTQYSYLQSKMGASILFEPQHAAVVVSAAVGNFAVVGVVDAWTVQQTGCYDPWNCCRQSSSCQRSDFCPSPLGSHS